MTGTLTVTVASGSNAFAVGTNGARVDFGTGASDYASSDGTTVTFAGALTTSGALTGGNFTFASGTSAPGNCTATGSGATLTSYCSSGGNSYFTLFGNKTDAANAVAVTSDNLNTLSTAGALIHSFRNNGAQKASVAFDGTIDTITGYNLNAKLVFSVTAPTISSGFGTNPSVATNNGTVGFTVNVGTGGTASSGVIGMPTASSTWICDCKDIGAAAGLTETRLSATSSTSCTVTNYTISSGAAAAWASAEVLYCEAHPI